MNPGEEKVRPVDDVNNPGSASASGGGQTPNPVQGNSIFASDSTIRLRAANRAADAAADDAKLTRRIKILMIVSILMDTTLLLFTALTIPGYQAVTRDTYLDNGTRQATVAFIRAHEPPERANVTNVRRPYSEAGIYVAYIFAVFCGGSLVIDVWCFLNHKPLSNPPPPRHDPNPTQIWLSIAVNGFLFLVMLAPLVTLGVTVGNPDGSRGGGRCKKRFGGSIECPAVMALFMFPEGVDYSLERDKWDSTIIGLKTIIIIAIVVTCIFPIAKFFGITPFVLRSHYPPEEEQQPSP